MSTATKRPWREAMQIAQNLLLEIESSCERIMIAGSLRRMKTDVGDIEIVAIPKRTPGDTDMFGAVIPNTGRNLLNERLNELGIVVTKGVKEGAKFKQFTYQDTPVDLFLPTFDTWGVVSTLRTGSAEFSRWLVTQRRPHGGGCPSHLNVKEGRVWFGAQVLETTDERDLFQLLEIDWIDPIERTDELAASLWKRR